MLTDFYKAKYVSKPEMIMDLLQKNCENNVNFGVSAQ